MDIVIGIIEVMTAVVLMSALVFVLWRTWGALNKLPAAISKLAKDEAQAQAKSLTSDFLSYLETPLAELQEVVKDLVKLQSQSADYAALEAKYSEILRVQASLANELENMKNPCREPKSESGTDRAEDPCSLDDLSGNVTNESCVPRVPCA